MDPSAVFKALVAVKDVVRVIQAQRKAYKQVGKAADNLVKKIDTFNVTLTEAKRYEGQPIFDHLQLFADSLTVNKDKLDKFLTNEANYDMTEEEEEKQPTSGWKLHKIHIFKRAFKASNLIKLFNETSSNIDHALKQLLLVLQVTDRLFQVGAHRFRDDMDPKAYAFWNLICQDDLTSKSHLWSYFISLYLLKFPDFGSKTWDADTFARMKAMACMDGQDMTIGGYIALTNQCGFPLDPTKLPSVLDSSVCMSPEARYNISTSINALIDEFATDTMRRHIKTIHSWYAGYGKDKVQRQARADHWATLLVTLRTKEEEYWNPEDILVDKVDMARRTLFYYYHRYLVIFKIGQLSKDLFKQLDFPGKPRMRDFINLVKPLDRANYGTVLANDVHAWDKNNQSKVPEVYKFVENYLESLEKEKTAAENASNATNAATSALNGLASSSSCSNNILTSSSHPPTDNGHAAPESQNDPSYSMRESEVDRLQIESSTPDAAF